MYIFFLHTGSQYHLVMSRLNKQPTLLFFNHSKMLESKETEQEWQVLITGYVSVLENIASLDINYAKNARWFYYYVISNASLVA